MNESVTGSANFFGPMTIETATSPEDLAAIALVVERLHGLRVGVRELEHDLAADPATCFFLARHEGEVVGSGVGKRSSLQGTLYAIARGAPRGSPSRSRLGALRGSLRPCAVDRAPAPLGSRLRR